MNSPTFMPLCSPSHIDSGLESDTCHFGLQLSGQNRSCVLAWLRDAGKCDTLNSAIGRQLSVLSPFRVCLDSRGCLTQVMAFRGEPYPLIGGCGSMKIQSSRCNSGQLWRAILAPELPMGVAEAVTGHASWLTWSSAFPPVIPLLLSKGT